MTKLELIERWFEEVWANENKEAIHEMFEVSGTAKGLGDREIAGPSEFEAFHGLMLAQIENVRVSVDKFMEQGDWVSILCSLDATQKGTNKAVQMEGAIFARVVDDKIVEAYNHFDFMTLFEQLGLMPANSFGSCLSGQRLC